MKLTIEKQEWQLLGQLALEATEGNFKTNVLPALLLWEFYLENIQHFTQPQTRKRKIKNSTAIGMFQYLNAENPRYDPLWDTTLQNLRDKLYQKIISAPTIEIIKIEISAN